eukprot:702254-Prymnesium_polylepis.1
MRASSRSALEALARVSFAPAATAAWPKPGTSPEMTMSVDALAMDQECRSSRPRMTFTRSAP